MLPQQMEKKKEGNIHESLIVIIGHTKSLNYYTCFFGNKIKRERCLTNNLVD